MTSRPQSAIAPVKAFDLRQQLPEDVLQRVERSMDVRLDRATLVYGTQGMTAGFRTDAGTWVRVQWRRPSLAALAEYQTERVGVRQEHLTLRINSLSGSSAKVPVG